MAMSVSGIDSIPSFMFEMDYSSNLGPSWKKFKSRFLRYVDGFLPEGTSDKRKVNILLHCMGDQGEDIFNSFDLTEEERLDLTKVLNCFDDYFIPATNVTYERYMFFTRKQESHETYEQYSAALKNLSSSCNFGTLREELVKDAFVAGIKDNSARSALLKVKDLDIESALVVCRSKDVTLQNAIETPPGQRGRGRTCYRCGGRYHPKGKCPAMEQECNYCGISGHFASVCQKNPRNLQFGYNNSQYSTPQYRNQPDDAQSLDGYQRDPLPRFWPSPSNSVDGRSVDGDPLKERMVSLRRDLVKMGFMK